MTVTTDTSPDPAVGWPLLVTQAGKDGNREVMAPEGLSRDLLRSILGVLMTPEEEPPESSGPSWLSGVKSVRLAVGDGVLTVVSRRVRATSDSTARVWSGETRRPLGELAGHSGVIGAVSVSDDGQTAATTGWDCTLRTWDVRTGRAIGLIAEAQRRFSGCCLDAGGRKLAAVGFDGTVGVFQARTGEVLTRAELAVHLPGPVTFDAGATVVLAGAQDGTIRRVREGLESDPLAGHEGPVTALALSPNGRLLASAGRDGAVMIWDPDSARKVARLGEHVSGATACAFLDPAHLLTAGWDGVVRLWDLPARTATTLWQDAAAIRALAVVGREVAISSQNGAITIVDPSGRADPVILTTGDGHVDTMAAATRSPVLVSGSTNDVPGGVPVRDGFGRAATLTEALLVPTADLPGGVTPAVWDRIHAESLTAMAIVAADPTGETVVASPRLPLG
jgi:WD40 repeat protein